mgnify:FL=1
MCRLVERILRNTIETNGLTCVVAIVRNPCYRLSSQVVDFLSQIDAIIFIASPNTLYHVIPQLMLLKLYCTLLALHSSMLAEPDPSLCSQFAPRLSCVPSRPPRAPTNLLTVVNSRKNTATQLGSGSHNFGIKSGEPTTTFKRGGLGGQSNHVVPIRVTMQFVPSFSRPVRV